MLDANLAASTSAVRLALAAVRRCPPPYHPLTREASLSPPVIPPALYVADCHRTSSVFYFGSPQYDEDEEELYDVDTQGIVDQRDNLGSFLMDEVAVGRMVVTGSRSIREPWKTVSLLEFAAGMWDLASNLRGGCTFARVLGKALP